MGENSAISWTDHTFNPWIGCTKVSPACDGCYAEAMMDLRYGRVKWGGERIRTSKANWRKPIAWNKAAESAGTRPRVFCASLADVFDNQVPPEWREDLFELIRITPNLTWLLLTKRPQNIVDMVKTSGAIAGNGTRYLPGNAALGTTIEDQKRADINVPALLDAKEQCGPAYAFVSCEPLLGPIDLRWISDPDEDADGVIDALSGFNWIEGPGSLAPYRPSRPGHSDRVISRQIVKERPASLDCVIAGGETDQGSHKARPSHPDWFRSLRDQCKSAGAKFHLKQWGEWADAEDYSSEEQESFDVRGLTADGSIRVGKKSAGRLLDGVLHDAMPEIER